MNSPAVTVIIPVYNRAGPITHLLESIGRQENRDFEVIIVDDGSTDQTAQAVRPYLSDRIRYFRKDNGERGAARNFGAARAAGRYLNFFDSDDLMYPNHIATAVTAISNLGAPEVLHLGYDYRTETGEPIRTVDGLREEQQKMLLFDNVLSCNGVFIRSDIAAQFPFQDDRRLASSEDWELWIRLICRYRIRQVQEVTSTIVSHGGRSIHRLPSDKLIQRDLLLIDLLQQDSLVMSTFGKIPFYRFAAERFTYFMLVLSLEGDGRRVWMWAFRAIRKYPPILWNRRFLASLRKTLR